MCDCVLGEVGYAILFDGRFLFAALFEELDELLFAPWYQGARQAISALTGNFIKYSWWRVEREMW